ncbi:hypothetical protein N1851_002120 [Merluccius polli]|uniref:DDE Tnp4 domain-containing protein n=1 Tax=Merluccius polli TaxID=89951 RepID=A0AA47NC51_MERPO|nr:hypothetical protein N1851_002120 [Merluccius polli]
MGVSTVIGVVAAMSRETWNSLVEEPFPTQEKSKAIAGEVIVFKYKGAYSIVLLAVVDAHQHFLTIDVGANGRSSDGGTLANYIFGLKDGTLNLPADTLLPGAEHLGPLPHVFEADEAFHLRRDLMRPFPGANLCERKRRWGAEEDLYQAVQCGGKARGVLAGSGSSLSYSGSTHLRFISNQTLPTPQRLIGPSGRHYLATVQRPTATRQLPGLTSTTHP